MNNEPVLLKVSGVVKKFGGLLALDGISFDLHKGEVLGLVGDNGAGKTTLTKVLAGVHKVDSGKIWMEGKQVSLSARSQSKSLGIEVLYQDWALIDTLAAPENLYLGSELTIEFLKGKIKILNNKLMGKNTVGILKEKLGIIIKNIKTPVFYLSGGEKQSIALGRVILQANPKIIILDEPTAALGPEETERILEIIRKLSDSGIAIIVISHNIEHIFNVCDRIFVLKHGKCNGIFNTKETSKKEIISKIIG